MRCSQARDIFFSRVVTQLCHAFSAVCCTRSSASERARVNRCALRKSSPRQPSSTEQNRLVSSGDNGDSAEWVPRLGLITPISCKNHSKGAGGNYPIITTQPSRTLLQPDDKFVVYLHFGLHFLRTYVRRAKARLALAPWFFCAINSGALPHIQGRGIRHGGSVRWRRTCLY